MTSDWDNWSVWEEVSDELLMDVYRIAKERREQKLIKIVLEEIRRRRLILCTHNAN